MVPGTSVSLHDLSCLRKSGSSVKLMDASRALRYYFYDTELVPTVYCIRKIPEFGGINRELLDTEGTQCHRSLLRGGVYI